MRSPWDWRNNTEVELPQVVIDLLLAQRANDQEWQNAIDLYQFVGLSSVMNYIDGLPSLRQYFGTTTATVARVSAAVAALAKAKTTTRTLAKVFCDIIKSLTISD